MSELVVVTGASGFIGSHVALRALESGYRVRLIARGEKAQFLRENIGKNNANVEVFEVKDISGDDLGPALKGANAIIHVASPLAGRSDPAGTLKGAVEGALHVLRSAVQNNIKKVVLTGSWVSTVAPELRAQVVWSDKTFTEKDWGHATKEELLSGTRDEMWIYAASKILAEKAAWEFAKNTPQLDLAVLNPPFVYGPYLPQISPLTKGGVGTNGNLYQLIVGEKGRPLGYQPAPYFCDVRDVATAHVAALKVPPVSNPDNVEDKRFLISGGHFFWEDAARLLAEKRPNLRDRLPTSEIPTHPGKLATIDVSHARSVLGISEYIGWEDTVLDTIDDIVRSEKSWDDGSK